MAKLVDFEQDPVAPDGYGVFHFDAGDSQYAFEPDLAAQVSKTKGALDAAPDMRVAGPGGGEAPLPGPVAPPPPGIEVANQAIGQALANRAAEQAQPMPQAPPPPPSPQEMAGTARDVMGQRAAADIIRGTKRTYAPGSPGVDPNRMVDQGVMVPTTASETFESQNALPYSPEAARERLGASHMVQQATLADMELNRQQTENQLASQRALAPRLQQAAADAENNQNRVIGAYRVDRARLQQDLEKYEKTAHVNPSKYFQDRSVFATIGLAIAQGLGAYATTKTGAPNFAYEMTQKAIDRDIAAQRDEIEAGRASRRNSLAQMMDDYGFDLQQAEAATRLAMTKSAEVQAQMFASESKLPHYQTEAVKFLALTNQDNIKNEQALQAASIGKHTRSVNNAFVQPKAATGGGYVNKEYTPQEMAALAKNLPAGQGQDVADLEPKERLRITNEYGEQRQNFASLQSTYDDLAKSMGYRIDWKTKQLVGGDGKPVDPNESAIFGKNPNIPGIGYKDDILNRQGAKRVQEAQAKARAITGKYLSGASVSPQQDEMIQSYLIGDDDASALRGMTRALSDLDKVDRDVQARYPEQIRTEYERRARSVNREIKTGPAPVKVNAY